MLSRLIQLLDQRELDAERVLHAGSISRAELTARDVRVRYTAADRMLEAAACQIDPAELGLALAHTSSNETYGLPGLLLLTAPTLAQGLRRAFAYQRLWGDGERFSLGAISGAYCVRFRHPGSSALAKAVLTECAFVEVLRAARALVDARALPMRVDFEHPALGASDTLAHHFGVAPNFERTDNRLLFDRSLLDSPPHAVSDLLLAAIERQCARALDGLPERVAFSQRVRTLLHTSLRGRPSLAKVAQQLRVGARTLQRRLQSEGTSFERLMDEERNECAEKLRQRGSLDKEIAFELGYADAATLGRARRRWRG